MNKLVLIVFIFSLSVLVAYSQNSDIKVLSLTKKELGNDTYEIAIGLNTLKDISNVKLRLEDQDSLSIEEFNCDFTLVNGSYQLSSNAAGEELFRYTLKLTINLTGQQVSEWTHTAAYAEDVSGNISPAQYFEN